MSPTRRVLRRDIGSMEWRWRQKRLDGCCKCAGKLCDGEISGFVRTKRSNRAQPRVPRTFTPQLSSFSGITREVSRKVPAKSGIAFPDISTAYRNLLIMHDPLTKPPDSMRELFKEWRRRPVSQIEADINFLDPHNPDPTRVRSLPESEHAESVELTKSFCDDVILTSMSIETPPRRAFEVNGLPGMLGIFSHLKEAYLR